MFLLQVHFATFGPLDPMEGVHRVAFIVAQHMVHCGVPDV